MASTVPLSYKNAGLRFAGPPRRSEEAEDKLLRSIAKRKAGHPAKCDHIARERGYASWKECEDVYKAKVESELKEMEANYQRLRDDEKIQEEEAPQLQQPKSDRWYYPERCHCTGKLIGGSLPLPQLSMSTEHLNEMFCPGNLKSPAGSMDGFDDGQVDRPRDGLTGVERTRLENVKVYEGEPSKRLSDVHLHRIWSLDGTDEDVSEPIAPWFHNDELIRHLRRQQRREKQGGRHPLAIVSHAVSVKSQSVLPSDPPAISSQNNKRTRESPEVKQRKRKRPSPKTEPSLRRQMASDDSPQSTSQLDCTASASPSRKRSRDEPEEEPNKRRRSGSGAEPKLYPVVASEYQDRQQPAIGHSEVDPRRSPSAELLDVPTVDEVQQFELETQQAAYKALELKRRLEAARQCKRERAQGSRGGRGIIISKVQVVTEIAQSPLQLDATTTSCQPCPKPPMKAHKEKKHEGRLSSKRGVSRNAPAGNPRRPANGASSIKKLKTKGTAGVTEQCLRDFLDQPLRTRSRDSKAFFELGKKSQPRHSRRTGRSW
ncbi:MAG: hypothetical protein L6R39_005863 [Caloplaca ligustica]|nr:MAG: hypothetical protein L6R39_005863 [Caloplaca ligustica]